MNSCLKPFWEKVTPLIDELLKLETNSDERNQIICRIHNIIEEINAINQIEHLNIFQQAFKISNVTYEEIYKFTSLALEKCYSCRQCFCCTNCSKNVYNEIIDNSILINNVPKNLDSYFSAKSQISYYNSFFSFQKNWNDKSDSLTCLKGFSSSTPILHSAIFNNQCSGGGFFLNIHGRGIVIDPGVGFVDLMHKNGISITDIDIVIITHNHSDHCADAPLISSLNYDFNRYYKQNKSLYELFEKTELIPNHKIKWILDENSKDMYKDIIKNSSSLCECLNNEINLGNAENEILLSSIRTKHDDIISSYGIKITSLYSNRIFSIGYTSDTCYLETFEDFFDSLDILIFNISDIYKDDLQYYKSKHSHLGYSGSLKLIKKIKNKPKLAVASEFCCTNGDFRLRIIQKLINDSKKFNYEGFIIPGEIGLKIDLTNYFCQCTQCKKMVPFERITIANSNLEYGKLQYICDKCTIFE